MSSAGAKVIVAVALIQQDGITLHKIRYAWIECCVGTTAVNLVVDFGTGWRIMVGVEAMRGGRGEWAISL